MVSKQMCGQEDQERKADRHCWTPEKMAHSGFVGFSLSLPPSPLSLSPSLSLSLSGISALSLYLSMYLSLIVQLHLVHIYLPIGLNGMLQELGKRKTLQRWALISPLASLPHALLSALTFVYLSAAHIFSFYYLSFTQAPHLSIVDEEETARELSGAAEGSGWLHAQHNEAF